MEKKTILVIFAVGLVLLFLIEPFAIGIIQSGSNAGSPAGAEGNATAASFTGTAVANVTVVRYEPYLIVKGNGSAVDAVKEGLISDGLATYAVWSGDSLVVSLKSSKDVPSAAAKFGAVNASPVATAYLATSDKVVATDGSGRTVSAGGISVTMQINPVYEEGSTHEASFAVRVDGGQVAGMGSLSISPVLVQGVPAEASLSSTPQETYSVLVAWKDRQAAKRLALGANATYREKSYVYVANATKDGLEAAVAGKEYATGTQPGIISVRNGYTDSETIGNDLLAKGYDALFPQSVASFGNGSRGAAEALLGAMKAENMSVELSSDWTAEITLPATLSKDGKQYAGQDGGMALLIEGTGAPRENVTAMNVSVDFEAAGNRIVRVTAVRPA